MQIRTIQLIMLMLWWPQVVNILLNIKMRCAKKSDNSFSKLPGNLLTDWSFQRQQMENIAMSSKALWYSNSSVSSLPDGSPLKFKARYCVHAGDLQTEGVDYFEMYLPVVQWSKFWNWFRVKGSQYFLLSQTLKGYNILDPPATTHQKAIPFCVLENMFYSTSSSSPSFIKHHAISQTSYGAFFHGMCSCKYSKTCSIEESKRTKILVLKANRLLRTINDLHILPSADFPKD